MLVRHAIIVEPVVRHSRYCLFDMNAFGCSQAGTVPRPFTYPCCKFRDARRTTWRPRIKADFSTRSVDQTPYRSPPLLLPAPGANSFSVTASAPDLSHSRHLATRLVRSSASKAGLSTPYSEEAAARYSDQLHTLVRPQLNTILCFKEY